MKYVCALLTVFAISGCGKEFAPDVLDIDGRLDNVLKGLLEIAIEGEACDKIEEEGFDCRIPEQVKSIKFTWQHDEAGRPVDYHLKFCLKENCPVEE